MAAATKTIVISNHSDILLQDVLQGVSALETPDIEQFMFNIGQLLASRKSTNLDKKETQLLKEINHSLPIVLLERYNQLLANSEAETMTADENEEYLAIHEKIQRLNVKRYKKIQNLANLRGVSVPTVMKLYRFTIPKQCYGKNILSGQMII